MIITTGSEDQQANIFFKSCIVYYNCLYLYKAKA